MWCIALCKPGHNVVDEIVLSHHCKVVGKVAELPTEVFTIALSEHFVAVSAPWFFNRLEIDFFFADVETCSAGGRVSACR